MSACNAHPSPARPFSSAMLVSSGFRECSAASDRVTVGSISSTAMRGCLEWCYAGGIDDFLSRLGHSSAEASGRRTPPPQGAGSPTTTPEPLGRVAARARNEAAVGSPGGISSGSRYISISIYIYIYIGIYTYICIYIEISG